MMFITVIIIILYYAKLTASV